MNTKFLGDAFDHWKGSLISFLSINRLVKNVVVEPMITNDSKWSKEDLETYSRLLKLESSSQICHGQSTFSGDRETYFDALPKNADIFLDPDIGIATSTAGKKRVRVAELEKLLVNADRVLIVYQHSARGFFYKRLIQIGDRISRDIPNVHYAVYECGRVAVFFISLNKARIEELFNFLLFIACCFYYLRFFYNDRHSIKV